MVARAGTGGAASGDRGERRRERVGAVGEIYRDFDTGGETEGAKPGGGGEADRGDYTAGIGEHQTGEFRIIQLYSYTGVMSISILISAKTYA